MTMIGIKATPRNASVVTRAVVHPTRRSALSPGPADDERIHRRMMSPAMVPGMTTVIRPRSVGLNSQGAGELHHQVWIHPSPRAPRYSATIPASTASRVPQLFRVKNHTAEPTRDATARYAMISSRREGEKV